MNRNIVGVVFILVILLAFPAILSAEDVSLDTLAIWIKEIAYEQDRQSERIDALEERVELLSVTPTATSITSPTGSPPPSLGDSKTPAKTSAQLPAPSLRAYPTHNTLGSIELDWNSVSPDVAYELQGRRPGQQWRTMNHSRPYIISFTHTGLENGITYYYRVRAIPYLKKPGRWSQTTWARTLRPDDISTPTPSP